MPAFVVLLPLLVCFFVAFRPPASAASFGPPAGTTVRSIGDIAGVPVILGTKDFLFRTKGCRDGLVDYAVTGAHGQELTSGSIWDYGTGSYEATVDALGYVGTARFAVSFTCNSRTNAPFFFEVLSEAAGTVVDTTGVPLTGAEVTVLEASSEAGPFTSTSPDVLGPAMTTNPQSSGDEGEYHARLAAGIYRVQATKAGCGDPNSGESTVTSNTFTSGRTSLPQVVLFCGEESADTTTTVQAANPLGIDAREVGELQATIGSDVGSPMGTVAFAADGMTVPGCAAVPIEQDGTALCEATFAHATGETPVEVVATYSGNRGHHASTGSFALTVNRQQPVITYGVQPRIIHPAPASEIKLGLTADVPGEFRLGLDPKTVLSVGYVPVGFTFVPDDLTEYRPVSNSLTIEVEAGAASTEPPEPSPTSTATPFPRDRNMTSGDDDQGDDGWHMFFSGASPRIDARVSVDLATPASSVTTAPVTTSGGGQLLVAFVSLDSPSCEPQTVTLIDGGGLHWSRVIRSTGALRTGATEIWQSWAPERLRAVKVSAHLTDPGDASLTVTSFLGAAHQVGATANGDGIGTPHVVLDPEQSGSLVWAAGHLADVATEVTPADNGSRITHRRANARIKDTYWTQTASAATSVGESVTLATDGLDATWQMVAVEIPAG